MCLVVIGIYPTNAYLEVGIDLGESTKKVLKKLGIHKRMCLVARGAVRIYPTNTYFKETFGSPQNTGIIWNNIWMAPIHKDKNL